MNQSITQQPQAISNNIHMLGRFLGQTINEVHGSDILDLIEQIRVLSKRSRAGEEETRVALLEALRTIPESNILPVARAFSQFLNLANIAEQYQTISRHHKDSVSSERTTQALFKRLKQQGVDKQKIIKTLEQLVIELVLTAHPTEVTRRSLVHKHVEINKCLNRLDHADLTESEQEKIKYRLLQLIAQAWHTNEIRTQRPTPFEEAKWGFAVIENSLWKAVPEFLRQLNRHTREYLDFSLPVDLHPIRFSSWMGGDRDGNPYVTANITSQVLDFGRYKATKLFLLDIQSLVEELSMESCTASFTEKYGEDPEPYRVVLKQLRTRLQNTLLYYNDLHAGRTSTISRKSLITCDQQLWEPLYDCYQSLEQSGMRIIANGLLLDCLYRIRCFGVTLSHLDIRQESTRHSQAIAEITGYLGLGDYTQWSEQDKQAFLLKELNSHRPLLPHKWQFSAETQDVLDTCKIIAEQPQGVISCYIISMARTASDVLAVKLLLKECGVDYPLPVVPLFETLDDLNACKTVMQELFDMSWYRGVIDNKQMVMIGYSDSAKDAGMMAASWAQYRAQEDLVTLCDSRGIELTLFHGRGGTIGRGGAPAHAALLSQPPHSLKNGLRVTEQGEMIRFKLGLSAVAVETLDLYTSAILEANLLPPPQPKESWRQIMNKLSTLSCQLYRDVIQGEPNFVPYFRAATPEQELSKLPLGSRPAKRNPNGGVESLRAIPWIFAWMQNRLMLPTWLGAGEAIRHIIQQGQQNLLEEMNYQWPFFTTRINMLEMVFSKTDLWLAEYYDQRLVPENLWDLGKKLRQTLQQDIQTITQLSHHEDNLMADLPWIAQSIALRNIYTDPLNLLQVELLARLRAGNTRPELEQALMITITGIAAGMRNTG